MSAALRLVPTVALVPSPAHPPFPKGLMRQWRAQPKGWRRKIIGRVWMARAELFAVFQRGGIPCFMNGSGKLDAGKVVALSKRSVLYGTVEALYDGLGIGRKVVHVLVYDARLRTPLIVRLPVLTDGEVSQ